MNIRQLTTEEFPLSVPLGEMFVKEYSEVITGRFIPEVYLKNWDNFRVFCFGTIFGLWDEETLIGGLGAILAPDMLDARPCAQEMFWFVHPEHRATRWSLKMLDIYEEWARARGAVECRVVHFETGCYSEALARVYPKRGYIKVESSYRLMLT